MQYFLIFKIKHYLLPSVGEITCQHIPCTTTPKYTCISLSPSSQQKYNILFG